MDLLLAKKLRDPHTRKSTQEHWWRMLNSHCNPLLPLAIRAITKHDIGKILLSLADYPVLWPKPRAQISAVFNHAIALEFCEANPAIWQNFAEYMPDPRKHKSKHHPALPLDKVPDFIRALREEEATHLADTSQWAWAKRIPAADIIELMILTAVRLSESLKATVDEFDLDAKVWTIPPERMKTGDEHQVPLAERAIELLTPLLEGKSPGARVFSGHRATVWRTVKRIAKRVAPGSPVTNHGFRSAHFDWCAKKGLPST
jgi:integrase